MNSENTTMESESPRPNVATASKAMSLLDRMCSQNVSMMFTPSITSERAYIHEHEQHLETTAALLKRLISSAHAYSNNDEILKQIKT